MSLSPGKEHPDLCALVHEEGWTQVIRLVAKDLPPEHCCHPTPGTHFIGHVLDGEKNLCETESASEEPFGPAPTILILDFYHCPWGWLCTVTVTHMEVRGQLRYYSSTVGFRIEFRWHSKCFHQLSQLAGSILRPFSLLTTQQSSGAADLLPFQSQCVSWVHTLSSSQTSRVEK